ncbi:class I SAM-dependent methyltransferase [Cetobacterium somerae]|uniref:class I SAM-dependent methyltransferase n=1 Tax=Cetobacterium somerae TaxID=188913 RepID=UPI00211E738D|nr:class I SAM-dependent methyltransferase [Cetobacterium somerae]MCQ9627655.1 class I SAM-dependent methyltransferase [Cetobacterium somerae]
METKDKYSRIANIFDKLEERMPMNEIKKEAVQMLKGKILEIGIGSGACLKYYEKKSDVTGIDFSIGMLNIAKKKAKLLGLENVKLLEMDIENMSFSDETFDSVFSSCVFCTIPNPKKGINEVYRVLKNGGKAVFIEHMKSENFIINIGLRVLNIFTRLILGTSLLRETEKTIREAGFSKVMSKNIMLGDVVGSVPNLV